MYEYAESRSMSTFSFNIMFDAYFMTDILRVDSIEIIGCRVVAVVRTYFCSISHILCFFLPPPFAVWPPS